MATVDRAGWEHEAFTPRDATDAVAYIAEKSGEPVTVESPDPEKAEKIQNPKLQVLNEYIGSVMNMIAQTREKGSVKIAITDRTPQGSKNKGFVEENPETGEFYIYLNPEAAKAQNDDILGAAIHEFPHILGKGFYGTEQIVKWYDTLTPDQKDQALAHYVFKDTRAHQDFSKVELSDDERKLLNQAKSQLSKEEMAHDWFSLEYARVLLGQKDDKSFNQDEEGNNIVTGLPEGEFNRIRELIDTYVFKPYSKYIGSGVRRANPEMFGQGIENRVSESAEALVPSEQKMRPEKMGPDEMYADILARSQWTVTPDQQLIYNGPDKQPSVGRAPSSIENIMEQRNLLLTDEKTVRTLERIAGVLPKKTLLKLIEILKVMLLMIKQAKPSLLRLLRLVMKKK